MHKHLIFSWILEQARQNTEKYTWDFKKDSNYNIFFSFSEPKPVQIVIPYESHSTSVVLFVQTPAIGMFDGIHIIIEGGPNVTIPITHDNKITVGNLTPGTEYNFFVSIVSGTTLSDMYYVPTVKTCKYFRTCIAFSWLWFYIPSQISRLHSL